MANYKQTTVAGESWVRARCVVIANELGQTPVIDFREEKVTQLADGSVIKQHLDHLVKELPPESFETVFNVLDPVTGAVTGTAKFQDVYILLHSLYYHFATERDAT